MNSVKEILDECTKLVDIAGTIEDRQDVYATVCDLQKEMYKLSEVYGRTPYDESLVKAQKEALNYAAINLEYVLSTVDTNLRNRYLQRVILNKMETKCREVILAETNINKVYQVAVEELARVRELSEQSKSIAFTMTDDDAEFVQQLGKKYGL